MINLYTSLYALSMTLGDRIKSVRDDERGASAVEYALLVGAIAAAVVIAVTAFGPMLKDLFTNIDVDGKP